MSQTLSYFRPPLDPKSLPTYTIFVGPNNSGKSAILERLYHKLIGSDSGKLSSLEAIKLRSFNQSILQGHTEFADKTGDEEITLGGQSRTRAMWIEILQEQTNWEGQLGGFYRQSQCIWMNGTKRLSMLPSEQKSNLLNPVTPLAKLFSDDARRQEFQQMVFSGIAQYPVIDRMTSYGTLSLVFSSEKPEVAVERGVDDDLTRFISNCLPRTSVSDGLNAYVGILGAIFSNDYEYILADEPEAFLHPALTRTLGKQVALHSRNKHIFVATHSADFLMGAIESGAEVRIVRLQYNEGNGTACLLDYHDLKKFMNDPLLRSANVLSGLFAQAVVVGESDTDRAFYQEINSRLLSKKDSRGIENAVFMNAQNKQTVPRIMKLLRNMGVPTLGVVDLDVLSEGGANWAKQMEGAGVPETIRSSKEIARKSVFEKLKQKCTDDKKKDYKRRGGINLLELQDKEAAEELLQSLLNYGVLVVPQGEVEAWLPHLGSSESKDRWLHEIFEKLGDDPTSDSYEHPSCGDVWDFLGFANEWLKKPDRKGMNV